MCWRLRAGLDTAFDIKFHETSGMKSVSGT